MTRLSPIDSPDLSSQRRQLRQHLLQQRGALDAQAQRRAAAALYERVLRWPDLHRARRLAFYLPAGGEIDPRPLLHHCLGSGAQCHLPVLSPLLEGKMYFAEVRAEDSLQTNRWGIAEPALRRLTSPRVLDVVFVPLVGFDPLGNRLGMGKGFYDRCFAFRGRRPRKDWPAPHRPILAGLAHDCQRARHIPSEDWDIPLDVVFTPGATFTPSG